MGDERRRQHAKHGKPGDVAPFAAHHEQHDGQKHASGDGARRAHEQPRVVGELSAQLARGDEAKRLLNHCHW